MENRTVFDTNVWISHILNSKLYEITNLAFNNKVCFLRSAPSIEELVNVLLRKKFKKYEFDIDEIVDVYVAITEFCQTKPLFKDCPDLKDNFLFDLAIQGDAKYLVSGDKKVLETPVESKTLRVTTLKSFKEEIQIVS